jgi:NAD(P)-dependent dehydrogenase (short-subunit alcohol dehydrogenase family)
MKVIITGTSSGLGKSLAKKFSELGHETIGISRSNSKETNYICDFSSDENIKNTFIELASNNLGQSIDYLFLNAGILGDIEKAAKIKNKNLQESLQINLFANKLIIDTFLNFEIEVKNIIAISSGASIKAYDGWLSYCLSKAALNQLIRCYAIENTNINFLSLAPGIIQTKMQDQIIKNPSEKFSSIKKFKDLYGKNPSSKEIANKIIKNLDVLTNQKSGSFFDLRDIND